MMIIVINTRICRIVAKQCRAILDHTLSGASNMHHVNEAWDFSIQKILLKRFTCLSFKSEIESVCSFSKTENVNLQKIYFTHNCHHHQCYDFCDCCHFGISIALMMVTVVYKIYLL